MKCECCGVEFVAKRKTAKFCSSRCRGRNHRPGLRRTVRRLYEHNVELTATLEKWADEEAKREPKIAEIMLMIALEPDAAKRLALFAATGLGDAVGDEKP